VKRIGPVYLERRTRLGFGLLVLWIGAAGLALAVLTLVFLSTGLPVGDGFRSIASATFGSRDGLAQTLTASTPLILTGLAVAVARRMGLWNLGGEGQLYLGATFAAALALWYPDSPRMLLLPAMLAGGAVGGGAWAFGPALARARLGINEIVTTLALNVVAVLLVGTVAQGRWRDPLALGFPLTRELSANAALPAIPRTSIHGGLLLAVGATLLAWFVLERTPWGRRAGPAAEDPEKNGQRRVSRIVLAMVASGALAGIAGMVEVAGVAHRLHLDLSPGYGYIGILVALFGRFSPVGVLIAAVPFAAVLTAGYALQDLGLAPLVVRIAQGAIVSVAAAAAVLTRFRMERVARRPRTLAPG
jgi:ABC-type uncharacterized transport system permease subunit